MEQVPPPLAIESMTMQEIALALHYKIMQFAGEALTMDQEDPKRKELLAGAFHCSLAGWILAEATPEQMTEIWEEYKPDGGRN